MKLRPGVLRQFNPATASIGDTVITIGNNKGIYRGCTSDQTSCLIDYPYIYGLVQTKDIFQAPLCYVEDKPVYVDDVVYYTSGEWWYSMRVTGRNSHVTDNENTLQGIVVDVGTFTWKQTHESWAPANMFSWTKPKVMITKTGWINIYPSCRPDCSTETGVVIYNSKTDADEGAGRERIASIQITWQQES